MPKNPQDVSYKAGFDAHPSKTGYDDHGGKDGKAGFDAHPSKTGYDDHGGSHTYAALLTPSNNSGALGLAVVNFDEEAGTLSVHIEAKGLTPGEIHPQHIHGFTDDRPSLPPTIAFDIDKDGFVETPEGANAIGPVLLSLTQSDQVTKTEAVEDFPVADAQGHLSFEQTYHFDLNNQQEAQIFHELEDRVDGRAVELHGLEVPPGEGQGTPYEVHGQDGYIAELPVAGGILHPVSDHAVTSLQHHFDLLA